MRTRAKQKIEKSDVKSIRIIYVMPLFNLIECGMV